MSGKSGIEFLHDLYLWVLDEIRAIFSLLVRNSDAIGSSSNVIDIYFTNTTAHFGGDLFEGEEKISLGLNEHSSNNAVLERVSAAKGKYARIILGEDFVLKRTIADLAMPDSKLRQSALADIGFHTPFNEDEVSIFPRNNYSDDVYRSEYFMVKTAKFHRLIDILNRCNLNVSDMIIEDRSADYRIPDDRKDLLMNPRGGSRWSRFIRYTFMGIVCLAPILSYGHYFIRLNQSISTVQNEVKVLQVDAANVRGILNKKSARLKRITSLRKKMNEVPPFVSIWEELSRALPDSAWVTDLQANEFDVQLSGFSSNAASIIAALEGSPMFKGATFIAPVIKVPRVQRERFAVKLQVSDE